MSVNVLRFFEHMLHNGTNENELVSFAVEKKLFCKPSELKARNLQSKLLCRYLGAIDFRGRRRYCGPQRVGVDAALLRNYWTTWNEPSTAFWRNIASMFLPANRVLADYAVLEQDTAFFSTTQASAQKSNSYLYTAGHLAFVQPGHNPAFIWAFLYQVCVSRSVTVSLGTLTRCDVGTDLCFQAIGVSSFADLLQRVCTALDTVYEKEGRLLHFLDMSPDRLGYMLQMRFEHGGQERDFATLSDRILQLVDSENYKVNLQFPTYPCQTSILHRFHRRFLICYFTKALDCYAPIIETLFRHIVK